MDLSWPDTNDFLSNNRALLTVTPVTVDTHVTGMALAERHALSTYDAMIVAAALLNGCTTLWSDDMHDGLIIDGRLHITDPFRSSP